MTNAMQVRKPLEGSARLEIQPVRSGYVWFISIVAALGGLLFGYDWVVIGGAKPFYEVYFHLNEPSLQGWAMSCALVGCLFGSLFSGVLSERFGRKPALIAAALAFTASSRHGLRGQLPCLHRLAHGRGSGYRPSLEPFADVYRRNRPREHPRQAGLPQ